MTLALMDEVWYLLHECIGSFFYRSGEITLRVPCQGCLMAMKHSLKRKSSQDKKENLVKKDPCVDFWLTLTAPLPTWGGQ